MDLRISNRHPAYKDSVEWLHQFANVEQKRRRTVAGELIIRRVLERFGRYPCIIVAGTKGKGSTAAMIESILRADGIRTGLFTSPHLHSFRERIRANGMPISINAFVRTLELLRSQFFDEISPTSRSPFTFELTTALSLIHFAQNNVDIAIYEVGCGGRSDPVGLISPCICAITTISLDHMDLFGSSLTQIAQEKAGIIRHNVPVVSSWQHLEVEAVIRARAIESKAPLYFANSDGIQRADSTLVPYPVRIEASTVSLQGPFQLENARVAVAVTTLLGSQGMSLTAESTMRGLATVSWPGRVEVLKSEPKVVVDGAHNADSAGKLASTLRELWNFERLILILGVSVKKDIGGIIGGIVNNSDIVIATQGLNSRALNTAKLIDFIGLYSKTTALSSSGVPEAITIALGMARETDLICITGSLFLVAEAREFFGYGQRD